MGTAMSETFHVYPVNDLIEHDTETEYCLCGPAIERVPNRLNHDRILPASQIVRVEHLHQPASAIDA